MWLVYQITKNNCCWQLFVSLFKLERSISYSNDNTGILTWRLLQETSVRSLGILKWQLHLISYKLCLWLHLDIHLYILNFCLKHHGLISFSSEHESNCFRHVHTKLTGSRCSFHLMYVYLLNIKFRYQASKQLFKILLDSDWLRVHLALTDKANSLVPLSRPKTLFLCHLWPSFDSFPKVLRVDSEKIMLVWMDKWTERSKFKWPCCKTRVKVCISNLTYVFKQWCVLALKF